MKNRDQKKKKGGYYCPKSNRKALKELSNIW